MSQQPGKMCRMQETQIIYWRTPAFDLPSASSIHFTRPVWQHSPEFLAAHGENWEIIHCNIVGNHESGDLIMAATMKREIPTDV